MDKEIYLKYDEINIKTIDVDKCRACESQVNLYNLFDSPENLCMKFTTCTSLNVMTDDELPKSICKECLNELNISYIFRMKCEKTNYKLKSLLKKVEPVIEEFYYSNVFEEEKHNSDDNNGDDANINDKRDDFELSDPEPVESINENSRYSSNDDDFLDDPMVKKPLICDTCGFEYKNIMLTQPLSNEKQNFECIKCKLKSRISQKDEKGNSPDGQNNIYYQCDMCSRVFTHKRYLKRHMTTMHLRVKPSLGLISSKSLANDILTPNSCAEIVNTDKNRRVDIFANTYSYNKNNTPKASELDNKTRPAPQTIICQYCGKKSFNMSNHTRHERIHTGETPFECSVCKKKFKVETSLKNHISLHTGIKSYECGLCFKKFRLKKSLSFHMLVHTGEKPYKCDICGKLCRLTQHLKSHKLTHSGEKKFECKVCGMTFRQMPHLKQHNFTHTGEKPHKCQYCNKAFAMRYNLTVHLRMHTGETPYECKICAKKFNDSKGLKRHNCTEVKKAAPDEPAMEII